MIRVRRLSRFAQYACVRRYSPKARYAPEKQLCTSAYAAFYYFMYNNDSEKKAFNN